MIHPESIGKAKCGIAGALCASYVFQKKINLTMLFFTRYLSKNTEGVQIEIILTSLESYQNPFLISSLLTIDSATNLPTTNPK
jgi:hypothetical protein